jgi:hypothetical protein
VCDTLVEQKVYDAHEKAYIVRGKLIEIRACPSAMSCRLGLTIVTAAEQSRTSTSLPPQQMDHQYHFISISLGILALKFAMIVLFALSAQVHCLQLLGRVEGGRGSRMEVRRNILAHESHSLEVPLR